MNTERKLRALAAAAFVALAAEAGAGCNGDLAPAWKIQSFRLFGARIENLTRAATDPGVTEAAPNDRVRVTLDYVDPSTTPRTVDVAWLFCAQTTVGASGIGCAPGASSFVTGTSVEYAIPAIAYALDASSQPVINVLALACAGGSVTFDPVARQPRCTGTNSESWAMTRSIVVRVRETNPPNHNPDIAGVYYTANGAPAASATALPTDAPLHVPHCATDPCPLNGLDIRVTDGSREPATGFDLQGNVVTQPERLQFGFFADKGVIDNAFRVDTPATPSGPVRNTWSAPTTPGTVHFVFTAQDSRGGWALVRRDVIVD